MCRTIGVSYGVRVFICIGVILLSSGCALQSFRNDAKEKLEAGQYEAALHAYAEGLNRYPEDTVLRANALNAREQIIDRLLLSATDAYAKGNSTAAEQTLNRLLAMVPGDERAQHLMDEVQRKRRAQAAFTEAKEFSARGLTERALRTVELALKDDPKNPDLLAFQRQIEGSIRSEQENNMLRLSETRPVTLEFRDANLRMVLEAFTRGTGVNFVVDKDVKQDLRITIFLRQAKLEDALELICNTSQLAKKILDDKTVLIYPNSPEKNREYQDLVLRAFYLSSADVKQAATLLKSMLKIREPFIDEKLSLLIIRESPETIRLAERLIALLDQAEPEVMMEVEVVEISTSRLTELGVQYPNSITFTPLSSSSSGSNSSGGLTLQDLHGLNKSRIGVSTPALTINLRREVGDTNILANPKIRTRNHEKAKIMIGDKLPVITSTATSTGFVSESVQYIDVGLKLEVEPTIYLDNDVAIRVGLEVSSLTGTTTTSSGTTAYQISTRSANTLLQLRDGETQILAGLINTSDQSSANRIPGLGDIPALGRLFSSQTDNGQRNEVVLSITPHIVRSVRRPELSEIELWSGTENNLHSRPFQTTKPKKSESAPEKVSSSNDSSVQNSVQAAEELPASKIATLTLSGQQETVVGSEFTISLAAHTSQLLRGLSAKINYEKDKLLLLGIEEGAFFKQGNATISFSKNIDEASGTAQVAALRSTADGVTGSGPVLTLHFKSIKSGDAAIGIASANPIGIGEPATMTVSGPITIKITEK